MVRSGYPGDTEEDRRPFPAAESSIPTAWRRTMPLTSGDLDPGATEQDGAPSSGDPNPGGVDRGGLPRLNPAKDGVDEACSGSDPAMGIAEKAAVLPVRSVSISFIPPLYSVSPSTSLSS